MSDYLPQTTKKPPPSRALAKVPIAPNIGQRSVNLSITHISGLMGDGLLSRLPIAGNEGGHGRHLKVFRETTAWILRIDQELVGWGWESSQLLPRLASTGPLDCPFASAYSSADRGRLGTL